MVREENSGEARLGEVREALQQELCTSYSAIVGLETQIQAVQRRQHLLQMDDKENCGPAGGRKLQALLNIMLKMLADEQTHVKSLEQRLFYYPEKLEIPGDSRAHQVLHPGTQQYQQKTQPQLIIAGARSPPNLLSPAFTTSPAARKQQRLTQTQHGSPIPQTRPSSHARSTPKPMTRVDGAVGAIGARVDSDSNPCLLPSPMSPPHATAASGRLVVNHEVSARLSHDMHSWEAALARSASSDEVRAQVQSLSLSLTLALESPHAAPCILAADLHGRAQNFDHKDLGKHVRESGEDGVEDETEEEEGGGTVAVKAGATDAAVQMALSKQQGQEDERSKSEEMKVRQEAEGATEPSAREEDCEALNARQEECSAKTAMAELGARETHRMRTSRSSFSPSGTLPSVVGQHCIVKKQWWDGMADRGLALKYAQLTLLSCDDDSASQGEEARKEEEIDLNIKHHNSHGVSHGEVHQKSHHAKADGSQKGCADGSVTSLYSGEQPDASEARCGSEWNRDRLFCDCPGEEEKRAGWNEVLGVGGTGGGKEHGDGVFDQNKAADHAAASEEAHDVAREKRTHTLNCPMHCRGVQEENATMETAKEEKSAAVAAASHDAVSNSNPLQAREAHCRDAVNGLWVGGGVEGSVQDEHCVKGSNKPNLTEEAARAASLLTAWLLAPPAVASSSAASAAAAAAILLLPSPPTSPSAGNLVPASALPPNQSWAPIPMPLPPLPPLPAGSGSVSAGNGMRSPRGKDTAVAGSMESTKITSDQEKLSGDKNSDILHKWVRSPAPGIARELDAEKRTSFSFQGDSRARARAHTQVASPTSSQTVEREGLSEDEEQEQEQGTMLSPIAYSKRPSNSGHAPSYSQDFSNVSPASSVSMSEAAWEKEALEMPVMLRIYRDPRILQDNHALSYMYVRGCLRVLNEGNELLSLTMSVDGASRVRKLLEMHQWSLCSVHGGSSWVSPGNVWLKEDAQEEAAAGLISDEEWEVQSHLDAWIHRWLVELDLAHCVEAFVEQRVSDCSILSACSHSQLENMGVLRLGDRCKLLMRAKKHKEQLQRAKKTTPEQPKVGKWKKVESERVLGDGAELSNGAEANGLDGEGRDVREAYKMRAQRDRKEFLSPVAFKLISAGFQLGEHQERIDTLELERDLLRDELSDMLQQRTGSVEPTIRGGTEGGGEISFLAATENEEGGKVKPDGRQEGVGMTLIDLIGDGRVEAASSRQSSDHNKETERSRKLHFDGTSETEDQSCEYERRLHGISYLVKNPEKDVASASDTIQQVSETLEQLHGVDGCEGEREKTSDEEGKEEEREASGMDTVIEVGELKTGEGEGKEERGDSGRVTRDIGESEDVSSPPRKKPPMRPSVPCQLLSEAGNSNGDDHVGASNNTHTPSPPRRMPPMSPRDVHMHMRHLDTSASLASERRDKLTWSPVGEARHTVSGRHVGGEKEDQGDSGRVTGVAAGRIDGGHFQRDASHVQQQVDTWEGAPKCKCTIM